MIVTTTIDVESQGAHVAPLNARTDDIQPGSRLVEILQVVPSGAAGSHTSRRRPHTLLG